MNYLIYLMTMQACKYLLTSVLAIKHKTLSCSSKKLAMLDNLTSCVRKS